MFYFCSVASELELSLSIPNLLSSRQHISSKKEAVVLKCVKSGMYVYAYVYVYVYVYMYIYHFYNFYSFTKARQYFLWSNSILTNLNF